MGDDTYHQWPFTPPARQLPIIRRGGGLGLDRGTKWPIKSNSIIVYYLVRVWRVEGFSKDTVQALS